MESINKAPLPQTYVITGWFRLEETSGGPSPTSAQSRASSGTRFSFLQLLRTSPAPQALSKVTSSSQCCEQPIRSHGQLWAKFSWDPWLNMHPLLLISSSHPASQHQGLPWWWQLASTRAGLDAVFWSKGRSRQIEVTPGAYWQCVNQEGRLPLLAGEQPHTAKRKTPSFVKNIKGEKPGQLLKDFLNNGRKLSPSWVINHGQRRGGRSALGVTHLKSSSK